MRYQYFILFAFFFLAYQTRAESPQRKCLRELEGTQVNCITYCTYNHYGFTNKNYKITKKHIEKFRDILIEYKAIPLSDNSKITNHIKACAKKAKSKVSNTTEEKCEKLVEYYKCVVDGKTLSWNLYAKVIDKYDKTFNV
uniref:LolSOBPb n=1 Tax=Bichromomyia olmeca TaxID=715919 RepID=A0A1B1V3H7_9DIPT|nr:LolSOBPb [Bichromomyia olmeca]